MVRVNPGNYADSKKFVIREYTDEQYAAELNRISERFSPLVELCKTRGVAMRASPARNVIRPSSVGRRAVPPRRLLRRAVLMLELIRPGGDVTCLVSGGADSTCLWHGLRALGYDVSAVHVHHGVRGAAADADAEHCRTVLDAASWDTALTHLSAIPKGRLEHRQGLRASSLR